MLCGGHLQYRTDIKMVKLIMFRNSVYLATLGDDIPECPHSDEFHAQFWAQ